MSFPSRDRREPPKRTRAVLDRDERMLLSARCEADCRTALARGLADYLEDSVEIEGADGRALRFQRVLHAWSEPETPAVFPSAVVYSDATGAFDASRFTPHVKAQWQLPPPDGRYLLALSEFVCELRIMVWATDPIERMMLGHAVEDAMSPTDFMYGLRLELPHYYNVRAEYELKTQFYSDSQEDAQRRLRRAVFTVEGRVPHVRLAAFPLSKPQARVETY